MGHRNRRLVATVSGLLLAGASIGALPVLAEDSPAMPAAPAAAAAPAAPLKVTISVPSVDATGSSIDNDTLKAILTGDFAAHADQLAKLDATSIKVPEIRIELASGDNGGSSIVYDYKDIDVEQVSNGVAQSASVGSAEASVTTTKAGGNAEFKFGKMSTGLFDIGGLLAFYGLVPGSADQPLKTIYKDFDFAGGSVTAPGGGGCTIGEASTAEFKARPLKRPFAELMALVSSPDFQKPNPPPEAVAKLIGFYVDFFTAFESSPLTLKSLDCKGNDDKGQPVAFSMGPLTIGGFAKNRYPSLEVQNLKIDASDAKISLGDFTMKSFDLSGPLDLLQKAAGPFDEAWFAANARKLVPPFEGFGFSDLKVDAPDPDNAGQRVNASVGDFDLSLKDYFAGVPTTVSTTAHHMVLELPTTAAGPDDKLAQLRQMGIDKLDLGFDLAIHRDGDAKTIVLDKIAMDGVDLGSITLGGTIGNADDTLFNGDAAAMTQAAMALTVKGLKLDVLDAGLADIVLKQAGAQQGMDLATARAKMSGMAEAIVLAGLGGTPEARSLGDAVGKFIAGGKSLSVAVTAKDPAGLTTADFAAAQSDPTSLTSKVNLDASAQ